MVGDRPTAVTLAGGLMVLAALGYGGLVVLALASGGVYLTALGGDTLVSLISIVVGYGPLVPLAAFLAYRILRLRFDRSTAIAFSLWFALSALDLIVLGGWQPAAQIALTAVLALAFVESGRRQSMQRPLG